MHSNRMKEKFQSHLGVKKLENLQNVILQPKYMKIKGNIINYVSSIMLDELSYKNFMFSSVFCLLYLTLLQC